MKKNKRNGTVAVGNGTAAKKQPETVSKREAQLIRKVIKRQESIARKDIADWKRARQQATSTLEPKQLLLQNLYEEVMLDALMTSQIAVLRIGKNQGADFTLKANGEKDEESTQRLKDSGLYEDLVELIIEGLFYGNSVVEFSYGNAGLEADLIPRVNISPEVGRFYPDAGGAGYINYRDLPEFGKWIVEFYPRKRDLGLLNKAVPYVLIKKFAMSCWSELCEIFGIPPRVMKTNTTDDGMLGRAEAMMREIGSAAYFIIDTTEEFEFAQGVSTNGDVYKNLISACDQQLSLLNLAAVLGQDTENGNRSKEESSSRLMEAVVKADKRLVEATFNKTILPALAAIGFLKPGLRLEIVKEVDIEKLWKMVYEAGTQYDIDPEWVRDTFGIEVAGRKSFEVQPPAGGNHNDVEERALFSCAPQVGALSGGNALTEFNERLAERVAERKSTYWDAELFWYISTDLLKAIRTPEKRASNAVKKSVEYNAPDDVYTAAMEQNLFHFSAAKTLAEVQELNRVFRESANFNDFKNKAAGITETFNDRWQRTEHRTAIQVAESASQYRQLKKTVKLLPLWVYRTVGDDRVRPEHELLDGLTLPADAPEWNRIYPPNDWNDRCWVDAIPLDEFEGDEETERQKVQEFYATPTWKKAVAQGWGTNRAESAEVFTANQMYIKKFPNRAASLVGKLYASHYGLDTFGKRLKQATEVFTEFRGKPSEWFAENSRFKDFSGKTVELPGQTFKEATRGVNGAQGRLLLGCIPDVLKSPDEVWINNRRGTVFDSYNYIKFYQGKAINVICSIRDGKAVTIDTWFEIEQNPGMADGKKVSKDKDPRWKYRRGLLIKK